MTERTITPQRAFQQQRNNAEARGIAWDMTFEQWWGIWAQYFHLRGRGKNGLCMARNKDEGPYAVGNVYLTTNLGNMADKRDSTKSSAKRAERRQQEIERGGAPDGYGWKHPRLARGSDEYRSQSIKRAKNLVDKMACKLDGDDISCAAEQEKCL